jgi:hypothetical protein
MIFIQELGCFLVNMVILRHNFKREKQRHLSLNQKHLVRGRVKLKYIIGIFLTRSIDSINPTEHYVA